MFSLFHRLSWLATIRDCLVVTFGNQSPSSSASRLSFIFGQIETAPFGRKKKCHLPKAFWGSSITWVSLKCVVSISSLWQLDRKISKIIVDVPIEMSISNGFPAMFDDREATTVCTGVDEGHLKEMVPYHQLL